MPWHKRLRWRLIAPQFLVAVVGVAVMLLATRLIILNGAPSVIRPLLERLIDSPDQLLSTESQLTIAFRDAVLWSVLVAAYFAICTGILSSYVLWRTLIAPLRQMAAGSQRMADGHYGERVGLPENSGEAMALLVTNFNQMAESLARVEEQRVTLLGDISHELRTPLTGLRGYLEALLDGLLPGDEQNFAGMLNEVNRLSRLVEDIHNLSRVEAGQIVLNLESFDVVPVARRIQSQILPQAQAKGVDLSLAASSPGMLVFADIDRTAQIMINLVGNALRYTPEGGQIEISVQTHARYTHVAVIDNGLGISAGSLPYLFERFYRVDPSRARASGGSGIGLTIARHLAWAMGGEIEAKSAGLGRGSTFTLILPSAHPPEPDSTPTNQAAIPA